MGSSFLPCRPVATEKRLLHSTHTPSLPPLPCASHTSASPDGQPAPVGLIPGNGEVVNTEGAEQEGALLLALLRALSWLSCRRKRERFFCMCCDYVAALCRFLSLCALHPAQEAGADPDPDPNPNPNRCWLYIAFSLSAESIGQNSDADLDRSTSYTTPQKRPRSNDADVSPHSQAIPLLRNCIDHIEKHQAKERRQGQG